MKKLVVQLVTWNGGKYIAPLLTSLKNQTYQDWELLILDNASSDNTREELEKALVGAQFSYEKILLDTNTGFAGGHNRLFQAFDSEYVLLLNQDMYLMPDCFEKMVAYLDEQITVAALSPRLMKWDFAESVHALEKGFTNTVDSLGLLVYRNRRVVDLFPQEDWSELKEQLHVGCEHDHEAATDPEEINDMEVFGVSGAFPMYRRSAMKQIAFADGTFFDEYYHSYKEDVDVAFRLRSAGYDAAVLLDVIAYQDRKSVV